MKKTVRDIVSLLLLLLNASSYSQAVHSEVLDIESMRSTPVCGVDAAYFQSLAVSHTHAMAGTSGSGGAETLTDPSVFPTSAVEHCGKFDIYYEDMVGSTGQGFDHITQGSIRRATLCAVLNYVQSVFDFSAVPAGAPIRLHVNQSLSGINPAPLGTMWFAQAGPTVLNTGPGIVSGFVFDYTTTGMDPALPNEYHAQMQVNFHLTYGITGLPSMINWHDNHTTPIANCQIDLFSTLLHEVGHTLGFLSYTHKNTITGFPESVFGSNQFSGLDYLLHKGDNILPLSLNKFIVGLPASPSINSLYEFDNTALETPNMWLGPNAAPDNHPVYSGQLYTGMTFMLGSSLSHLDEQVHLYTKRARISPGDTWEYVMSPFGVKGILRQKFTDAEIETFLDIGYPLNPGYSGIPALSNLPPYSTKMAAYPTLPMFTNEFPETVPADFPALINDAGATLIFNLASDPTLIDPDGDPISIHPGSLVNIRGCGNGGNNHDQLTVSGAGTIITFTPRPDFYGRAQFGFKVTDGMEVGSYVFYTIDVLKGNAVSCSPGENMILNGDLEEGTEVRRLGAEETIDASQQEHSTLREGKFRCGIQSADCHPYCYVSTTASPFGSGDFVKESHINCNGTTYKSHTGGWITTFPVPGPAAAPDAAGGIGQRYRRIQWDYNYFNLCYDVESCKQYVLEFDYHTQPPFTAGTVPLTVGFTNNATYPALASLEYSFVHTFTPVSGGWQHITIPFNYCGTSPAGILNLRQNADYYMLMDNFQLKEVTTPPPPLVVNVFPASPSVCPGNSVTLSSTVTNALCDVTYLWSTGDNISSITVNPAATTTYDLTVNDGCRTTVSSVTVTVNPLPVVTFGAIPPACSGGPAVTLTTGSPAGGTYSGPFVSGDLFTPPTVTVATSYTLTYTFTDTDGCTNDETQDITVVPAPTVVAEPNMVVCADQVLPANTFESTPPGATFTWTNSNTAIGLAANGSGDIPSFIPINTTGAPITATITITPSLGACSGTTSSYNITVIPSPTVVAEPDITVCAGTLIPLNSFTSVPSGATFTWTNSNTAIGLAASGVTDVPAFTATNSSASPITATITITPTLGPCHGIPSSYTITVNPQPVVTFESIGTACSGGPPITLAFGSPAGGIYSGPFVSGGVFTPPVVSLNTTYTLTYTYTDSNGCTGSDTQDITVYTCITPCSGCTLILDAATPGVLASNPAIGNTYCLNNNLTVTNSLTIAYCEIRIAPTVVITVNPGVTLTIAGSHLYSCSNMWQGIVVQPGGAIVVQNYTGIVNRSSLIEDAMLAIDIPSTPLVTNNVLTVNNATFNKNHRSIRISDYSHSTGSATYPMTVVNSVFTCRKIDFSEFSVDWPSTNSVKASYGVTVMQTPYINDLNYPDNMPGSFLKAPLSGQKPKNGISLVRVGSTSNTDPIVYHEMRIGTAGGSSYNVFDNLGICIDGLDANFTCANNVFQRTIFTQNSSIAVNAVGTEFNARVRLLPGSGSNFVNKFYDCATSLKVSNYLEVIARYCELRSQQNISLHYGMDYHRGQNGFVVNTHKYTNIDLSFNKMYNIENGIFFSANSGTFSVGSNTGTGQLSGQVTINQNRIQPHPTLTSITNQYVKTAITANNTTSTTLTILSGSQNVSINTNVIEKVFNGISCNNWHGKTVINNSNVVSLATNTAAVGSSQTGISHANNIPAATMGNQITSNRVTGIGLGPLGAYMTGIATSLCNNQVVKCNTTKNIYKGILFSGNEIPTTFSSNTFDNSGTNRHKYAYVLNNNGFIGPQGAGPGTPGSPLTPSDNKWTGTWDSGIHFKTATMGGSWAWNGFAGTGSKLWVRNTPGYYNPSGPGYNVNIAPSTNSYNALGAINITTSPTTPPAMCAIGICIPCLPILPFVPAMEKIARDEVTYDVNDAETRIISMNQLYRTLKFDPTLRAASTDMEDFFVFSQTTYREDFCAIEQAFVEEEYSLAQTRISNLSPASDIENNYKDFYNVYVKQHTDTLLNSDSTLLYMIANGCPFTDGAVVYQARAMYNAVYDVSRSFEDNCVERPRHISGKTASESSFDVELFPNPSTGLVYLMPEGLKNETILIGVQDISGKSIYSESLQLSDGRADFNLDVSPGVYFVSITNTKNNEAIIKKLVIQK